MKTNWARAFRIVRAVEGVQQQTMAKRIGISVSGLSLIESGKRNPSLQVIDRFCNATATPIVALAQLASLPYQDNFQSLVDEMKRLRQAVKERGK